eukprot:TRINITY_DN3203_c0_g3_i1.p1 TRINITY_DN3203_c0_g3~~TRINITY_DN3203_c0_g3_i1.p1  ORF type:complete len:861 (-),score=247.00 TRINITY_DN3203_c0_g3_i1:146-2521(-)
MANIQDLSVSMEELELVRELGRGAYGTVHLAQWSQVWSPSGLPGTFLHEQRAREERVRREQFAVKMMQQVSAESAAEFRREVALMSVIRHPNLVHMRGFCLNPPFIMMELVPLGDLYSYLHDSTNLLLSWHHKLRIALEVARGMAYLHSIDPPIIHRDLKSPNILIHSLDESSQTLVKIADFGLSCQMYTEGLKEKATSRDVQTPTWLAPEVMCEMEYSKKADVYSLGIIMWELLTRQHPYDEYRFRFWHELETAVLKGVRPRLPEAYTRMISAVKRDEQAPSSDEELKSLADTPDQMVFREMQKRHNMLAALYVELMQRCWHTRQEARPSFAEAVSVLEGLLRAHRTQQASGSDLITRLHKINSNSSEGVSKAMTDGQSESDMLLLRDSQLLAQPLCMLTPSDEPHRLLGAGEDGVMYLWDTESREMVSTHTPDTAASPVLVAPNGSVLWMVTVASVIVYENFAIKSRKAMNFNVTCAAKDGNALWLGSGCGNVIRLDESLSETHTLHINTRRRRLTETRPAMPLRIGLSRGESLSDPLCGITAVAVMGPHIWIATPVSICVVNKATRDVDQTISYRQFCEGCIRGFVMVAGRVLTIHADEKHVGVWTKGCCFVSRMQHSYRVCTVLPHGMDALALSLQEGKCSLWTTSGEFDMELLAENVPMETPSPLKQVCLMDDELWAASEDELYVFALQTSEVPRPEYAVDRTVSADEEHETPKRAIDFLVDMALDGDDEVSNTSDLKQENRALHVEEGGACSSARTPEGCAHVGLSATDGFVSKKKERPRSVRFA